MYRIDKFSQFNLFPYFIFVFFTYPQIQTMNESVTVQSLTAYTIYQFDIVGKYTHSSYQSVFGLPSDPVSFIARTSQDGMFINSYYVKETYALST